MLLAPWTTWLLVRISPSEVRIMPVPAASDERPVADAMTVLMSTTAELILLATAWASIGWLACEDCGGRLDVPPFDEPLFDEPPICGARWIGFCATCEPVVIAWITR